MTQQPLFGDWRPLELLGYGSVAEAWSAKNEDTGESGLLKVLRKDRRDDFVWRARFLNEIDTLDSLDHPAIPKVIEDGMRHAKPYMVITLFPARAIPEVAPLSEDHTVSWAIQIADALSAVHANGLIHADVKSTHVLVSEEGRRAFLVDFDMCVPLGMPYPADNNAVRGSRLSAPPERFRRQPEDARSDLFGLGVAMYHSLTARAMHDVSETSPRRLADGARELYAAFSPQLRGVMDHLVHPDVNERFDTAEEAKKALQGVIAPDNVVELRP